MATYTANLGLALPAVSDAADIHVLNENFRVIDGKFGSTVIADCNAATKNGWYRFDASTLNIAPSASQGSLFVSNAESSSGVIVYQTMWNGYWRAYRFYGPWDGTWTEWEFENPPMLLGVEYRTTERWNGKAVYAKLIDFGVLPNTAHKVISTGFTEGVKVISYDGLTSFGQPIPFNGSDIDPTNIGRVELYVNPTNIWIYASRNMGGMTAQVRIKYTKD